MNQPGARHGSQRDRTPAVPMITLNNALTMPQLGFGVFRITPEQASACTRIALQAEERRERRRNGLSM
jgi:hypothetical protein